MKPVISDACVVCGACQSTCPAVFKIEDGAAKATVLEADYEASKACIEEAIQGCPQKAISWE